jgi:uncharacterized membrane protein YcaP (DUF421 family)
VVCLQQTEMKLMEIVDLLVLMYIGYIAGPLSQKKVSNLFASGSVAAVFFFFHAIDEFLEHKTIILKEMAVLFAFSLVLFGLIYLALPLLFRLNEKLEKDKRSEM